MGSKLYIDFSDDSLWQLGSETRFEAKLLELRKRIESIISADDNVSVSAAASTSASIPSPAIKAKKLRKKLSEDGTFSLSALSDATTAAARTSTGSVPVPVSFPAPAPVSSKDSTLPPSAPSVVKTSSKALSPVSISAVEKLKREILFDKVKVALAISKAGLFSTLENTRLKALKSLKASEEELVACGLTGKMVLDAGLQPSLLFSKLDDETNSLVLIGEVRKALATPNGMFRSREVLRINALKALKASEDELVECGLTGEMLLDAELLPDLLLAQDLSTLAVTADAARVRRAKETEAERVRRAKEAEDEREWLCRRLDEGSGSSEESRLKCRQQKRNDSGGVFCVMA